MDKEVLRDYVNLFEDYAIKQMQGKSPKALYDPILYTMKSSAKRIRPVLCLMACRLFNGNISTALPAAYALEIFHNFTLLHDDIMDKAELRRGQPSVYKKYGIPSAILSGDTMLVYAYQYLLHYQDPVLVKAMMEVFTENAIGVCEGQQSDMDFEATDEVSIDEYMEMIANKTSILLGVALQIGAMIGNAHEEDQKHLYLFGKYAGMAFQIHDDVLDVFGESTKVGKQEAGDIVNNKKTYLYLKALELGTKDQIKELKQWYALSDTSKNEEKIKTVKKIFESLAVQAYANELKEAYLHLGISHLKATKGSATIKEQLIQLASYLIARDY